MLQQSKLAQMGEMISMIAHQWRQPLGAISSAIISVKMNMLNSEFNLDNKGQRDEFLSLINDKHQNISEYVKILTSTIEDFRTFFKPNKVKEKVSLLLPINRALDVVKLSMNSKNIEIVTNFNVDSEIDIYQNEMMQVILNILKNSEDNFEEQNIKNKKIYIVTKQVNDKFIISISDNGGGIQENILCDIFNPYFSTKLEKNGTGLGLYMSKIMIEEHNNGILTVTNNNQGVCFEIILKKSKF